MDEQKSYNIRLTDLGARLLNEANANKTVVNITHIAIGDGGGAVIDEVDLSRTELVREFGRQLLDAGDGDTSFISGTITVNSSDYGGQAIREVGLIDENGNLIAYSDYPESMIPTEYALFQGFTMQIVITLRMLIVNAENAVMVIDENTATATKFELATAIDDGFAKHKAEDEPHVQYKQALIAHNESLNPHQMIVRSGELPSENIGVIWHEDYPSSYLIWRDDDVYGGEYAYPKGILIQQSYGIILNYAVNKNGDLITGVYTLKHTNIKAEVYIKADVTASISFNVSGKVVFELLMDTGLHDISQTSGNTGSNNSNLTSRNTLSSIFYGGKYSVSIISLLATSIQTTYGRLYFQEVSL